MTGREVGPPAMAQKWLDIVSSQAYKGAFHSPSAVGHLL